MNKKTSLPPEQYTRSETDMPELVAQLYCAASPPEKSRLLEHLVRPLNLLPLFALADGVFARIWFRSGQEDLHIRAEDAQMVSGSDIAALVAYVQQSSAEVLDGMLQIIHASPVMAGSAAAIMVMMVLRKKSMRKRTGRLRINQQTP